MFSNATSFNQDLSNWDVSNVRNFSSMFGNATSFNQDLSNWDVSNGSNFRNMFYNATSFNQNLSLWDVNNSGHLTNMFYNTLAARKQRLSDTPNVSYFDATTGDDTITGSDGVNDALRGHDGDDNLSGLSGNDTIFGDNGNDILKGGFGNDRLFGGPGRDTAVFSSRNNTVDLGITTRQRTGDGRDVLKWIENVKGGAGKDILTGNDRRNTLNGENGNDRLYGGGGNDLLIGGLGYDQAWGQGGRDTFRIQTGAGRTIIKDFQDGEDRIHLASGYSGLRLKNSGDNVRILLSGDLMAIVENISADQLQRSGNYLA